MAGPCCQVPPSNAGNGPAVLEASRRQGLEGVVAKRLDSTYEPGRRSRAWLKVKHHRRQEFVIGGWTWGEGRRQGHLGALLLGYYDGEQLRYAGNVGTGFTDRMLRALAELLEPLRREILQHGRLNNAALERVRTARRKRATRRQIEQRRRQPWNPAQFMLGVQLGQALHQQTRVGVPRIVEDLVVKLRASYRDAANPFPYLRGLHRRHCHERAGQPAVEAPVLL